MRLHANDGSPDLPVSAEQSKTGPDAENQAWITIRVQDSSTCERLVPHPQTSTSQIAGRTGKCPQMWKVSVFKLHPHSLLLLCFNWSWIPSSHQRDAFFVYLSEHQHCFHLLLAFCSFVLLSLLCYVQLCTILKMKKMLFAFTIIIGTLCFEEFTVPQVQWWYCRWFIAVYFCFTTQSAWRFFNGGSLFSSWYCNCANHLFLCCNFLRPQ